MVIEKLQAKEEPLSQCSKAIKTVISDSELAVDSLERIVDDIILIMLQSSIFGCSFKFCGSVAAVFGIKGLLQYGLSDNAILLSVFGVTLGACIVAGGTSILRQTNATLDFKVNKIVKSEFVPPIEKLIGSISELQMQLRAVLGVCVL